MTASPYPSPDVRVFDGAFDTDDGLKLFEQGWQPEEEARAAVALVHGYAEHSGRYARLGHYLAQREFAVFTYDQRGFGRSEGRRALVSSFDRYLDDLHVFLQRVRRRLHGQPLFLFGHSMGGAVSALYCLERDDAFTGLLLSSPALRVGEDVNPVLRALAPLISRIFPTLPTLPLDRRYLSHNAEVVAQAESDPLNFHGRIPARTGAEIVRASERIRAQMEDLTLPLLLIHGTDDQITDPRGSQELYFRARSEDKTLGLYPGLYHETFNEPEGHLVLDEIACWLDEHTEEVG